MPEKYTLAECARLLGQDVDAVMRLIESGDLEHDLATGEVRVDGAALTRLALKYPHLFLHSQKKGLQPQ